MEGDLLKFAILVFDVDLFLGGDEERVVVGDAMFFDGCMTWSILHDY